MVSEVAASSGLVCHSCCPSAHSLSASFPYLPRTSADERGEHWGFLLPSTCCDDQSQPVGTSGLEPPAHSPLTPDLCPCISSDAQSHFSLVTAPQAHSAVADNLHSGSPVLSHFLHPSYHGSYFLCLQRRPTTSTGATVRAALPFTQSVASLLGVVLLLSLFSEAPCEQDSGPTP